MKFWNWLGGGRRQIEQPEMIWLTNAVRMAGVLKSVQEKLSTHPLLIVTSHFSGRVDELRKLFDQNAIDFRELNATIHPGEIHREFAGGNGAVVLLTAATLLAQGASPVVKADSSYRVALLAVERHPLRLFEERIESFANSIPYEVELQFYSSLDDVAMQMFAGEWVRNVLTKLGMKEDEAIASSMIARRLQGAQRKVEERYESLQGLKRGLALERLREEPPREWKNAAEWLAAHGMEARND